MKFILTEDIDNNPSEEEINEIKDSVQVKLNEDMGYKQCLIDDARTISEKLKDFLLEFEGENDKQEFLNDYELKCLQEAAEILDDFKFSYSIFASRKAREFLKRNKGRGL